MPAELTYPGVYIEEVPSGVRTIVGVATSITAFAGRARKGPVATPTDVFGFDEFVRVFGGLWRESALPYAVRDFFQNGGGHAVIVRLHKDAQAAELSAGGLKLKAASPGRWGADLRAQVDLDVDPDAASRLGVPAVFNVTVTEAAPGGRSEKFVNVSLTDSPRKVTTVLEQGSQLVRAVEPLPGSPAAGVDPLTQKEQDLATARMPQGGGVPDPANIRTKEKALRDAQDAARNAVSDGSELDVSSFISDAAERDHTGLFSLEKTDLFNLLCIPPHSNDTESVLEPALVGAAATYCEKRRAMLIVDPRPSWASAPIDGIAWRDEVGTGSTNAALYFPRLVQPDPELGGATRPAAPCGTVAGVYARTDATRGVWKAPAGLDAGLVGAPALEAKLTDQQNGQLNPLGINCLRSFPVTGRVVWGARTLDGADILASDWKYVPIRRLALYIEESLFRGTKWVVFEPNDEPLWAQIRLSVGSFMHDLFRQGAFQGTTPRDAYFVKCDAETTTQSDRNKGIVNIHVGFAPLKPAEFVVIRLQQIAGQIEV